MSADRCSILVVDDEPYLLPTLRALLIPYHDVLLAGSADEAEAILRARPVDILLTDQRMPHRTGVQLLEWAAVNCPDTIRLLMTGFSELEDAVEAINRGHVYHYLLKPWRTEDLLQVIRNAADKYRLERKRDELMRQLQDLNRELERRVVERTRELQEANSQLEQRTRELEQLAMTDARTGLLNLRAIEQMLAFELKRLARWPGPIAVGYVDVDHFKQVNKDFTQTGGDEALRGLARVLTDVVRGVDSVSRVGGEEFLILARETGMEGANVLAERIRTSVEQSRFTYNGREIRITVSIGFAVLEPSGYHRPLTDAAAEAKAEQKALIDLAAEALKEAKDTGRNRHVIRVLTGAGV